MPDKRVQLTLGWGADPIGKQFPDLNAGLAAHFDADNQAIVRLHSRGLITDTQRNAALKKLSAGVAAHLGAYSGKVAA